MVKRIVSRNAFGIILGLSIIFLYLQISRTSQKGHNNEDNDDDSREGRAVREGRAEKSPENPGTEAEVNEVHNWKVAYHTYRRLRIENENFPAVGFSDPRVPDGIEEMAPTGSRLLDVIREVWLLPRPKAPRNLIDPSAQELSHGFRDNDVIEEILGAKNNGFFIEAGAADGEIISNTLYFEVKKNWTGLLVEPDPIAYTMLKMKRRDAYIINICLSTNVSQMTFRASWLKGGPEEWRLVKNKNYLTTVYCFPLQSILDAIGQTTVDYFSLDVEGSEPYVLRGIDFDKVDIKVFRIEHAVCGLQVLKEILEPNGYTIYKKLGVDVVFVKNTLLH